MLSLVDIAKMTSFTIEDIMETLKLLDLLKYYNGQYILTVPQNLLELSKPVCVIRLNELCYRKEQDQLYIHLIFIGDHHE